MKVAEIVRTDVVTAGRASVVVPAAIAMLDQVEGEVYDVSVHHDKGCPSTAEGATLDPCTCEVIWLLQRRVQ